MSYFIYTKNHILLFSVTLFILSNLDNSSAVDDSVPFSVNYSPTWGGKHLTVFDNERQVQLLIDEHQGGAGFNSKKWYGSGLFRMKMKMPKKRNKGILTTFYLTAVPVGQEIGDHHDEIDIEFLGGSGRPYILSTNVFADDIGYREQMFSLWFDPTEDYHIYEILYNQHQIVFLVDKVPIRVFKNLRGQIGANYPSRPMIVETSIWNYTNWLGPVDWTEAPFVAYYSGFNIDGCEYNRLNPEGCNSQRYYWNAARYLDLSPIQKGFLDRVRRTRMVYDYCADMNKHFVECNTA